MPTDDPILTDIMTAVQALQSGERSGGRRRLEAIWAQIEKDPRPLHEMTLAHYLADAQDNPNDALVWDTRALSAALRCTDEDASGHSQAISIAAFMPSLHLNLAEDYLKLGEQGCAREHLTLASSFAGALADDGYGRLIRGGIERLGQKLGAGKAA